MSQEQINLPIIGVIHSPLKQKFGTPRQPNLVNIATTIQMLPPYNDIRAFEGIDQFSHLWVIWQFHQNRVKANDSSFQAIVRPPRLGGNERIGVFASRSMYRPANIGLSVVKLSHVEVNNNEVLVHILGADMVDGTPVLDIKPYLTYSDSIPNAVAGYAANPPSTKLVKWSTNLLENSLQLKLKYDLSHYDLELIQQLIAQDPRPAYRQQEFNTEFVMRYGKVDVCFRQTSLDTLEIVNFKPCN